MYMKVLLKYRVLYKSPVLFLLTWIWSVRIFYHHPLADRHYALRSLDSAELRPNCAISQRILGVCCWILNDLFISWFCLGSYSFICSFTQCLQHSFTHPKQSFTDSSGILSYIIHPNAHAFTQHSHTTKANICKDFLPAQWVQSNFLIWIVKVHN